MISAQIRQVQVVDELTTTMEQSAATPGIPSTEASSDRLRDLVVLPGSVLYKDWIDLLAAGKITYEEFIDWTTPARDVSPGRRILDGVREILDGFTGLIWRTDR